MVYRLVGSYEYSNAIRLLSDLLSKSSIEEVSVYDQIIKSRPEFDVFILAGIDKSSTNPSKTKKDSGNSADSQFVKRNGIAWVMALARNEIAGILATYSDVQSPFLNMNPTLIERQAYVTLLKNDALTHYRALVADPAYKKIASDAKKAPNSDTITYLRRLKLVSELVVAARQSATSLTQVEHAAYDTWYRHLYLENQRLHEYVRRVETQIVRVNSTSTIGYRGLIRNCFNIAEAARKTFEQEKTGRSGGR
jgi:hypothetical protein